MPRRRHEARALPRDGEGETRTIFTKARPARGVRPDIAARRAAHPLRSTASPRPPTLARAGILSARGSQGPATRRSVTSEAIGRCVGRPTSPPGGARSSPGLRLHRGLSDPGVGSPGDDPRTALHSPHAAEGSPLTLPSPRSCPLHRGLRPSSCLAANGAEDSTGSQSGDLIVDSFGWAGGKAWGDKGLARAKTRKVCAINEDGRRERAACAVFPRLSPATNVGDGVSHTPHPGLDPGSITGRLGQLEPLGDGSRVEPGMRGGESHGVTGCRKQARDTPRSPLSQRIS